MIDLSAIMDEAKRVFRVPVSGTMTSKGEVLEMMGQTALEFSSEHGLAWITFHNSYLDLPMAEFSRLCLLDMAHALEGGPRS